MKFIPLTQGKFAIVDDEDYDWLMTWKWCAVKQGHTFYAYTNTPRSQGKTLIGMHRFLMCHPKGMDIDHINHNGLDNRRSNIRIATRRENAANRTKQGTSRFTGVCRHTTGWVSDIQIGGINFRLGWFKKEQDAAYAYQNALNEYKERRWTT